MPKKSNETMYIRELSIPETLDKEKRQVTVVLSTETPCTMYDWERGYVDEILLMDGVVLPDEKVVSLVDSHKYDSIKNILGSCTNLRVEKKELVSEAVFSSICENEWVKVAEKHIRKLSIGYDVHEYIIIPAGTVYTHKGTDYKAGERDLKLSTKWELLEGSLVTLPADNNTKIRNKPNSKKGGSMPKNARAENEIETGTEAGSENENTTAATEVPESQTTVSNDTAQAEERGAKRDRIRQSEIRSAAKNLGIDETFIAPFIDNGTSYEEAVRKMIEELGKRSGPVPPKQNTSSSRVSVLVDGIDNISEACEIAMSIRSGINVDAKKKEAIKRSVYNGVGFVGTARALLAEAGVRGIDVMSNEQIIKHVTSRAMAETSSFVNILANVANKSLQKGFQEAETTYQAWCGSGSLPDFKVSDRPNMSLFSGIALIAEGAPFVDGTFTDLTEQTQIKTYGGSYAATRQMLVNDDLGKFNQIGIYIGSASKRNINRQVYAALLANAAMSDTVALFHADHNNLKAAGGAPSVATLGAARSAMRKQKSNGVYVGGVTPQFIIVNPDMEVATQQLLGSIYDPANGNNTVNPFNSTWPLQLVCDVNLADSTLTGYDANAWYLAASPNAIGTISVLTLNGNETPIVRSEDSKVGGVLGVYFDTYFDFAIAIDHFAGLYKNDGGA